MTAETSCFHDAWNVKDRHEEDMAEADDDDDDDGSHRDAPSDDGHDDEDECPDSPSATTEIRCSSSEKPMKQKFDPEFKEDPPAFQRRLSDARTHPIPPSVLFDFQEPRMPVPVKATAPLAIGGSHLMAVIMAKGRGTNLSHEKL